LRAQNEDAKRSCYQRNNLKERCVTLDASDSRTLITGLTCAQDEQAAASWPRPGRDAHLGPPMMTCAAAQPRREFLNPAEPGRRTPLSTRRLRHPDYVACTDGSHIDVERHNPCPAT
jgi:hypothetical protein